MLDNQALVERLLRRRDGPVPGMRSMMIIGGGAMRGVYGAGIMLGLHQLGLTDVFDIVIGISTGAPTGAYYLCDPAKGRLGASIYYEECPRNFIRWSRIHRPLDFSVLMDTFQSEPKVIDVDTIRAKPTQFYVVATNTATGQSELIDTKTARPDFFSAIHASIAIPTFSKPVAVNGATYIDGDIDPLPAKMILDYFKPTDILVIPNRDERGFQRWHARMVDAGLSMASLKHRNLGMAYRAATRSQRYWNGIRECIEAPGITTGIIWPPHNHPISIFTTDARRLKQVCVQSIRETCAMFGQPDMTPLLADS